VLPEHERQAGSNKLTAVHARRRALRALLVLPLLAMPAARPRPIMRGTFLQLWPDHLLFTTAQWRQLFARTYRLGCRDLVLQWVGLQGGDAPWQISHDTLQMMMDEAAGAGLGVQLGAPYDERWWKILSQADGETLRVYLAHIGEAYAAYVGSTPWARHPAFRGWYIPYEVEQFNWSSPERMSMLAGWLAGMVKETATPPGISTYYSQLRSTGSLTRLWNTVLDSVAVRPMVQDGAGVAGLGNYNALAPVLDMLKYRGIPFDLIIELFEEIPSARTDGTTFTAVSAEFGRVQEQLHLAARSGAHRVLGFAAEPWLLGDTPGARRLQSAWHRTYG